MTASVPLSGLRVLDLSRTPAASMCARILVQLGATLDRRDPNERSSWTPALFSASEVIVIDLEQEEARSFGFQPAELAGPGCVVVSVTRFGLSNPDPDLVDCDSKHEETDEPVVAALSAGHAAAASLAALRWARHHERRVRVDVAALEVLAACQGDLLPRLVCPRQRRADAPRPLLGSRTAVLECADGHVGLTLPTEVHRADLASLTGIDALRDPTANLGELLGPWLHERTRYELFHLAQLWRLPLVPVLEPEEVLSDEQNMARGVWVGDAEGRSISHSPFRFTPAGAVARQPARPDSLPLSDIRVLDLGVVWAGPYCGRLLAGLGARVTRIERPTGLGDTHSDLPHGCWGVLGDLNRGKDSLVLDLSRAPGRELFLRLVGSSDILVENFSPRVMRNLGLDSRELAHVNPGLLTLSMPAFGSDGPWADYVAYGSGLELATGLAARATGGLPAPAPVPYLDYLAGCYGAVGLLAALLARDRSGEGLHLEVAQREVACQLLGMYLDGDGRRTTDWPDPGALVADPHLAEQGLFASTKQSEGACYHLARLPWRLNGVPTHAERETRPAGADSRRVLRTMFGVQPDQIDSLIRDGIVETHPRR